MNLRSAARAVSCMKGAATARLATCALAIATALISVLPVGLVRAMDNSRLLEGAWVGEYHCRQGVVGLKLMMERFQDHYTGVFIFFPIAANPNVPEGRFNFTATLSDGGQFSAEPHSWIVRPPEYVMVAMEGLLSADAQTLKGDITDPACGPFWVNKSS